MKIDKCNKLVCNLHDKKSYVVHIRSLKQALNHGLILKKVHRTIELNQKAFENFEKDFYKLMNNAVFRKTMKNARKHRDIKLVTRE